MHDLVTLIIILHNRHRNLDRLLEYYHGSQIPIIIADSSNEKHVFREVPILCRYAYTPYISFTRKIENILNMVQTPYVVMCADDDFIVPRSIKSCVHFLSANSEYMSAQGYCLAYIKNSVANEEVDFRLLYPARSYDIEHDDPFVRLERMFRNYKSILYAVHRTAALKIAFRNAGPVVRNLFLNEYLTAVVPIVLGKYKDLPLLYQVREFAEDSDDKITDNLDVMFTNPAYKRELDSFVSLVGFNLSGATGLNKELLKDKIYTVLKEFSLSEQVAKSSTRKSWKKRIGSVIYLLPVIGQQLVSYNRKREIERNLRKVVRSEKEKEELSKVESLLKKYAGEKTSI